MKNLLLLVFLFSISTLVFSQDSLNRYPKYPFAIGVEHRSLAMIFRGYHAYPDNLELSARFSKKWHGQAGVILFQSPLIDPFYFNEDDPNPVTLYAGITLKLWIFNKGYFTPQWNFYYTKINEQRWSNWDWKLTTGPTISFEGFYGNRISIRLDVLNLNYGIGYSEKYTDFGFSSYSFLGLGLRYNFDIGKKLQ